MNRDAVTNYFLVENLVGKINFGRPTKRPNKI